MQTYTFIGSDKNAGKTTAFNYIYRQQYAEGRDKEICLSSIGINGEELDSWEGSVKPSIELFPDSCFITRSLHLQSHAGRYRTLSLLGKPDYSHDYVLGRCMLPIRLILEGPNRGSEVRRVKQRLVEIIGDDTLFLIDGSIDRKFLAKPEISDSFYFSVLFSRRPEQIARSRDFLRVLSLPACSLKSRRTIEAVREEKTKSLLLNSSGGLLYHGKKFIARDEELKKQIRLVSAVPALLYLNGGVTSSLGLFLAAFPQLEVVLDNITLLLPKALGGQWSEQLLSAMTIYRWIPIKTLFINQETEGLSSILPAGIPVKNIFRCNHED